MIEFVGVSKQFGPHVVLDEVSFRVLTGDRVGVVGPNGAGKSTLFSLIQGDVSPDRGEINLPRQVRLGHLRQQLNAHEVRVSLLEYTTGAVPKLAEIHARIEEMEHAITGSEGAERERGLQQLGALQHAYEDLGGYEMTPRAEAALSGLGFAVAGFSLPFASFSGGWQMRAELARTLIAQPDILLLDEPSNYLDLPAVEWLQRYLREFSGTMLLISHDRYLLETLTRTTLEVADGGVARYPGRYSYYARERMARHAQLVAARKNQDRKRDEIERFVERFRAKNTKASQVQSRLKALERMETIKVTLSSQSQVPIRLPKPPRSGAEVIRLEDAGAGYTEGTWVLRGVNLSLARGDKLALVGYNGMGKTTLLRMLSGRLPLREGAWKPGHKVVVGYQSQEFAETMPPNHTVAEILRAVIPESRAVEVRSLAAQFGFTGDAVDKVCRVLSGGEKIRLAFARIFANPPNLLLLDEPTTHLDLQGRETLEEALRRFGGTVCLVSHDVEFVRGVATSIVAVAPSGLKRFAGGYDYYLEKRGEEAAAPAKPGGRTGAGKTAAAERRERARRQRALEKEMQRAEAVLERLEEERAELVTQLGAAPAAGTDYAALNRRLQKLEEDLAAAGAAWERAGLALEEDEAAS